MKLSSRQIDYISSLIVTYSSLRYLNSKVQQSKIISSFHDEFPESLEMLSLDAINFESFDKLVRNTLRDIDFNTEDILYSFIKQKLCVRMSIELLEDSKSDISKIYLQNISI